ncbi:LLM class F420-dependent oxidoreductase [Nocardia fluminea]|uniref:LLM class F420-dependent oxidoreductase n=1 Tax=Nocardia fluminea TaxID=134984 RepID=UPI003712ACAF
MSARRVLVEIMDEYDIRGRVEFAEEMETRGFAGLTMAEVAGPDAFVVLAMAAAATKRVTLEPAVAQCGVRSAPALAVSAATVQDVASGRFRLGLGISSKAIVEDWHGREWSPPMPHARETVELLRAVLSGEKVAYDGRVLRSSGFRLGGGAREVPLHLAALNEGMVKLAGSIADGVWLNYLPRAAAAEVTALIDGAAVAAGRDLPTKLLVCYVEVTDDPPAARAQLRDRLAFYVASPAYRRAFAWHGFESEMADAGTRFACRDRAGVLACITDELIDSIVLVGSAGEVRDRMEEYFAAGVDEISVAPLTRENADASLTAALAAQGELRY